MPLYGASQNNALYGKQDAQVLSERNRAQAQQLGLPDAHVGGAGSQVEANDPFVNFEDFFNKNKSYAEGAAKAVGDKVAGEAPPIAQGTFNGGLFRGGPEKSEAPSMQMPQPGEGRQRPGDAPAPVQMAQVKLTPNVPQATPSNYLTSLQAQSDEPQLTQLKGSTGGGLLTGFAEPEVTAHQYEDTAEEEALDADRRQAARDGWLEEFDAQIRQGIKHPVRGGSPVAAPVAPATTTDPNAPVVAPAAPALPADEQALQDQIDKAKAGAAASTDPTKEEMKKLDQLRKVNEMLGAWGQDEGLGLMQEIDPNAGSWDAALMQVGGGKALHTSLNESYGGKDLEYEQKLGSDLEQRAKEKQGAIAQQGLFEKGLSDLQAQKAAAAQAEADRIAALPPEAKPQGMNSNGVPTTEELFRFDETGQTGMTSHEDIVRGTAEVSDPVTAIWNRIGGAGQSPLDKLTSALESKGYSGIESKDVWGRQNDSRDLLAKKAVDDFKAKYGEDMLQKVWAHVTPELWQRFLNEYNLTDIYNTLENIMKSYGYG